MDTRLTTAFIFDFDGTLVDSEQAIYQCFQNITKRLAPERIDYSEKILIGPPLRETASEILGPEHQDLLDEFVQLFIAMHDEKVIQHTEPYADVNQVLKELHTKNIPMALATNKRLAPTKKLINYFGWNNYFISIECSDSQPEMRNKNSMIMDIIHKDQIFQEAYFVGDTVNDAMSANKNHLRFVQATYGYGSHQIWDHIKIYKKINKFNDILQILY